MAKRIVGGMVGVPNPQSDWKQTDPKKADYIKNKPNLEQLEEDVYASIYGVRDDLEREINLKADDIRVTNLGGMTSRLRTDVDALGRDKADKTHVETLEETVQQAEKDIFDLQNDKADTSYVDEKFDNIKITTDDNLSATSENPVQNKVITSALNTKADSNNAFDGYYDVDGYGASYKERLYKAKSGFVIQSVASYSESSSYWGVDQYWYTEGKVYYRQLGDEGGWENEWNKVSLSQTDLDNTIGDIETSLENIIKKYGLGGDSV